MILKEAKYKKVRVWQRKTVSSEVYGCDCCKSVIKEYPNEENRLELTLWPDKKYSEIVKHLHFCSWLCVLKYIITAKSNYFASLPHLMFDATGKKTATELIQLLKTIPAIEVKKNKGGKP